MRDPLQQAFERWDGKGSPAQLAGDQIARIMRIVHVANDVEALHRLGGVDAAVEMLRSRRGTEFDPELVDRVLRARRRAARRRSTSSTAGTRSSAGTARWAASSGATSSMTALEAFADYADIKSPYTLGHSRGVAQLAAAAAATIGLPNDDVVLVRRAALVHDIGAIGVSSGILDKPGRLDRGRARADPHPPLPHDAHVLEASRRWPRSDSSPGCTTSGWTAPATRQASGLTGSR